MSSRFAIGATFFGIAMAGCLIGNTAIWRMIAEVDQSRPQGKRFSERLILSHHTWEIVREYRRLFPHGGLRGRFRMGVTLFILGCIGSAACMFLRSR